MIENLCEDNEITNFREVCMGTISRGVLYRGAYPFLEADHERNKVYEHLAANANISCVLNLGDNESGLARIAGLAPWYRKLLERKKIIGLDMQFAFGQDFQTERYGTFKNKLKQGLQFLMAHNGPYLIHCHAGIDRTGFVAAVLQALLGANLSQIVYDYLLSHGKKVVENQDAHLATGSIILNQLDTILDGKVYDKSNFQSNIEGYLLKELGLTLRELDMLVGRLNSSSFSSNAVGTATYGENYDI